MKTLVLGLSFFMVVVSAMAGMLEQTKTGFVYPLGTSSFQSGGGGWLGRDAHHDNDANHYFDGYYHIGVDMLTRSVDASVYAIADGHIYLRHCKGDTWGDGNCALFIQHTTSDGRVFTALYGHLQSSTLPEGDDVVSGQYIGKTGLYPGGIHVHFGIFLGTTPPATVPGVSGWGMMNNSEWEDPCDGNMSCTNGFVNPVAFIQNNAPGSTRKMYHYKTVGWIPFVDLCTDANQWFRLTKKEDGTYLGTPADASICAEVPPACFLQ